MNCRLNRYHTDSIVITGESGILCHARYVNHCNSPQSIPALSFAGHRCKGFGLSIVHSTHPHSFRIAGGLTLCYLHCPPLSNQTPQRLRVIHGLPIASARASARYYLLGFAGLWARVTNPMRCPQGLVMRFALYCFSPKMSDRVIVWVSLRRCGIIFLAQGLQVHRVSPGFSFEVM